MNDFTDALLSFVVGCQKIINEADLAFDTRAIVHTPNAKYIRINRVEHDSEGKQIGCSVLCFVCSQDGKTKALGSFKKGDVMKPASYKMPAKHARGNIFNQDNGLDCMSWTGPNYLK